MKPRKLGYQNGPFIITYEHGSTEAKRKVYGDDVAKVDNVFYVEPHDKPWRYTKEDAVAMVNLLLRNMVYFGEQEIFKNMLKEKLNLCDGCRW